MKTPKTIKCPKCGEEIDATALISARAKESAKQAKGTKKTMSPEAIAARQKSAKASVEARRLKKLQKES
jgi:hypothetical protein